MSLQLPTWRPKVSDAETAAPSPPPRPPPPAIIQAQSLSQPVQPMAGRKSIESELPREMVLLEKLTRLFTAKTHWELSTTLTTNHLLAIISLAYTLMSMNNATFVTEQERSRILHR